MVCEELAAGLHTVQEMLLACCGESHRLLDHEAP